jgi:hypothetical protein
MLFAFRAKDRLLNLGRSCKSIIAQLAREGSPPPGLRLRQAKLSRKSNAVARGRIREFESKFGGWVRRVLPPRFADVPPYCEFPRRPS